MIYGYKNKINISYLYYDDNLTKLLIGILNRELNATKI